MGQAAHSHQEPQGAALIDAAQEALLAAGEQWTPMRAAVFKVIAGFVKPASAYDIADGLSRAESRRIAANSVYRILDLFVENNIVLRIESKNAYIVNAHPGCRHDCIFLVCDVCSGVEHIDDDAIATNLRDAVGLAGFDARRPVIEVCGTCATCKI
jgi:Fur family zinc uptake transcriptional regulator